MMNMALQVRVGDLKISADGMSLSPGVLSRIDLDVYPRELITYLESLGIKDNQHGITNKIKLATKNNITNKSLVGYVYSPDGIMIVEEVEKFVEKNKQIVKKKIEVGLTFKNAKFSKNIIIPLLTTGVGVDVLKLPLYPVIEYPFVIDEDLFTRESDGVEQRVVSFGNSSTRHRASVFVLEGDGVELVKKIRTYCGAASSNNGVVFYNTVGVTCKKCGQD